MHIVFVTTELATQKKASGGLASFTTNIGRIFKKNGHEVTILLASIKQEKIEFDEDIDLRTTFINKKIWNLLDILARILTALNREKRNTVRHFFLDIYRSGQVSKKIKEIDRRNKIDIIHYCDLRSVALQANRKIPYMIRMSSMATACRGAAMPIAKYDYENIPLLIKERIRFYVIKKARFVVSPSKLVANMVKKQFKVKVEIIESPFCLNNTNWNVSLYNKLLKEKKYILHFGSLQYLKGTHIVAELVEELLQKYSDIYIVLAGNSTDMEDEFGNKVKAHELVINSAKKYANRVIYVGELVREELYPIIYNSEICLLPSRIENLSNACIEAMAMGKIVVATNGASYEQLIDDRISGFLCERDNAKSFMKAIEEGLELNKLEKERMKEKAIERTKQLSPEIIYGKYLNFYNKVIAEW